MYINSTRTRLCIVLVLACVLCCITTTLATSKDCQSDQTGSSMSAKRSAAVTLVLDEDIEFMESHVETLKFRLLRRIGRSIGRAISGVIKSVMRVNRRRKSLIIEYSKDKFNGYIGPNSEKLQNRNPYIANFTVTIEKKKKKLFSKKVVSSYTVTKHQECVACRVNCMKSYSSLGGSLFHKCSKQYYYYGCELVAPCYKEATSSDEVIEGMIGICAFRNGCTFKDKEITKNEKALKRTIKRIRSSQ